MSAHHATWSWSPPAREEPSAGARSLADRLRECAGDRTASGQAVTREAARELRHWLSERPRGWGEDSQPQESVGLELERGWQDWARGHAWRGPCSLLLHSLRRAFAQARDAERSGGVRQALIEELEHWLQEGSADGVTWNGQPFTPGLRLPSREALASSAVAGLQKEEAVLVHGYSETVIAALAAAQRAGLAPYVTVGAGAPDQSGKRMARELNEHGLGVRLVWDAVALASTPAADRVWLGTEALGPDSFVGLVGTGLLLEEATRAEVPVELLCTCDKWVPGGDLGLPAWGAEETWNLWSHPAPEAQLDSQPFETASCELVGTWITERGRESLVDFSMRGLRVEAAVPCASY